jgi:hypothetical protein
MGKPWKSPELNKARNSHPVNNGKGGVFQLRRWYSQKVSKSDKKWLKWLQLITFNPFQSNCLSVSQHKVPRVSAMYRVNFRQDVLIKILPCRLLWDVLSPIAAHVSIRFLTWQSSESYEIEIYRNPVRSWFLFRRFLLVSYMLYGLIKRWMRRSTFDSRLELTHAALESSQAFISSTPNTLL